MKNLPRSAALAHLYRAAEAASPPNHPPESMFAPSSIWEWLRGYSAYISQKEHAFPPYTASPQAAMYDLHDENGHEDVRVSIAGDWGTGTDEAEAVANHMKLFNPHFTVHIGDVYYIGGGRTRFRELRKRGVSKALAAKTAGSPHGPWRLADSPALHVALPNAYFAQLGLPPMVVRV